MPRNMSFSLTTEQYLARTKTVTRRFGWRDLPPGKVVNGVKKAMGLKKGEKIERLGQHRIVSNEAESLQRMLDDEEYGRSECVKEGFPGMEPAEFVAMLLKHNGKTMADLPQRIEYEYV